MKVLVTGATGYVGAELVPLLVEAGHSVRALVRTPHNISDAETVSGILPDAALCKGLCAGVDAVVHLAAIAHVNADADRLKECNLDATLELAAAAKEQGARKFIFLSSSKARYPEHSAYARYKAEAETALRTLHQPGIFEVVCLRPALIYGQGMKGNLCGLLRMLSRPALPVFVGSDNSLGLISVRDVCRAVLAALTTDAMPDRVWELADGTHYTLNSLVRDVREVQGLAHPIVMLPRSVLWLCAAGATVLSPLIKTSLSLSTYKALFAETYRGDSQFSIHTGFAPQDSLFSELPDLLEDVKR
jgi:nucleoside-diphosphate-sugar epimerase